MRSHNSNNKLQRTSRSEKSITEEYLQHKGKKSGSARRSTAAFFDATRNGPIRNHSFPLSSG